MTIFVEDERYSNDHIRQAYGGYVRDYLCMKITDAATKERRVLFGRLTLQKNPEAPYVILAGTGPRIRRAAQMLAGLDEDGMPDPGAPPHPPVPIFVKTKDKDGRPWSFRGYYRVRDYQDDRQKLSEIARRAGRGRLSLALYMDKVAAGE